MELALIVLAVAVVLAAVILAFARPAKAPEPPAPDSRLDALLAKQGEIGGQFTQTVAAQEALTRTLGERLEALEKRMGENLTDSATRTAASIAGIGERLTVIDEAQKNISALSGQVVSLQQVLSNKQARGAFGQAQMEEIVRDGLPVSLYDFQFTLSNRNRPDCIIRIPGNKALLVIDSKFPLEAFELLRHATTDEEKKSALTQVRASDSKHVDDIAEKYLIPGEVQTPAIMFVPSESIYADLHDGFRGCDPESPARQGHRGLAQYPDAGDQHHPDGDEGRPHARAGRPDPNEVGAMLNDVRLLDDRVLKLQSHFNQADADIKNILMSTGKITSRGEKIEKVELAPPDAAKSLN